MRVIKAAALATVSLGLLWGAAALAQPARDGAQGMRTRATAAPRKQDALTQSQQAVRAETEARQRRWDERMRRVTNSLCNGC